MRFHWRKFITTQAKTTNRPRSQPQLVSLEDRTTPAVVSDASPVEQYLLELHNKLRADPTSLVNLIPAPRPQDINEGLPAGTIPAGPKQPLAWNNKIAASVRLHVQYNATVLGELNHTDAKGGGPAQRAEAQGYELAGAENLSLNLASTIDAAAADFANQQWFVDTGVASRGHRINQFSNNREFGGAFSIGKFQGNTAIFTGTVFGTKTDFANFKNAADSNAFLTGVVFTDTTKADNFYTPGEGVVGTKITVTQAGKTIDEVLTGAAGGYSIELAPGTYDVTFTAPDGQTKTSTVTIDKTNIKQDFLPTAQAKADTTPPTAVLGKAPNIGAADKGEANYSFSVTYADDKAFETASLVTGNVRITGPNGFDASGTFVNFDQQQGAKGPEFVATYRIVPPGGTWDDADKGTYTVKLAANSVADVAGNKAAAADLGTFTVDTGTAVAADTTPPTAAVEMAENIDANGKGITIYRFQIRFSDDKGVDVNTLKDGNVVVNGPNGFTQAAKFSFADAQTNGTPRIATYAITIPDPGFAEANKGTYTLDLQANQVADEAGNKIAGASLGSFTVDVLAAPPADAELPVATLRTAPNIDKSSLGKTEYQFSVNFTDNDAVKASTLANANITIAGSSGFNATGKFVSVDVNTDGTPRIGTYSFAIPGGWSDANKGTYTLTLIGGTVTDVAGNKNPTTTLGTFNVDVSLAAPVDTTPPTATVKAAPSVASTGKGAAEYEFTITYTDNGDVSVATLTDGDTKVTGPNNFSAIAKLVSVDSQTNGSPRSATYKIATPGGGWSEAAKGTYTISLIGDEVSDEAGNKTTAATLTTFPVDVTAAPLGNDGTPPSANFTTTRPIAKDYVGKKSYEFNVEFTDDRGVNLATIDGDEITVVGPFAFQAPVTKVSADLSTNGKTVKAVYSFEPPGGDWDDTDNGEYLITILDGKFADTAGNLNQGDIKVTLNADLTKAADTTPPTAKLDSTPAVGTPQNGQNKYTFTVIYADNDTIDASTLDDNNIKVTGPNNFSQMATFESAVPGPGNGTPLTVTYSFVPPGGTWDPSDNGNYDISLLADQVDDPSTNSAAAGKLGSFAVNIQGVAPPNAVAPTAAIGAAAAVGDSAKGATTYDFTVDYADANVVSFASLDSKDIRITGPNNFNVLATFVKSDPATDGKNIRATYRITPPGGSWDAGDNGKYTVAVELNQVFNAKNTAVPSATLSTFTVGLTVPDRAVPTAKLGIAAAVGDTAKGATSYDFTITYTDDVALNASTFDGNDVRVTGPSNFNTLASFVKADVAGNGTPRTVTYRITPPGGSWDNVDNGTYTIAIEANQVFDTTANKVAAGSLGTFVVTVAGTNKSVLVGFPQFAAGSDKGTAAQVQFYNADKSPRLVDPLRPFGDFSGGIRTASADFNADGIADIVVGTGPGRATRVLLIDGANQKELFAVDPFEASFTGGVYVAAGDVNGDGTPDLAITPDEGGGPRVDVFSGKGFVKIIGFLGIDDSKFRGGARASIADISGDGTGDLIVVAGFGGGPRVAGFDGKSLASTPRKVFNDFFAFEETLRNGVFVTAGDLNGDGFAELICGGGPGGGPRVLAFSGKDLTATQQKETPLANFFGGDVNSRGGIRLAVKDLDSDNLADLVVGSGTGSGSKVTAYLGKNIAATGTPTPQFDFDSITGFTGGVFVG
jgi:hypothetical protein